MQAMHWTMYYKRRGDYHIWLSSNFEALSVTNCYFSFFFFLSFTLSGSYLKISWLTILQGFYYDAFYDDLTLNEENFNQIQSRASKAAGV